MSEFSQMQTLVLVTDLGSLAAAARKLGISPAAVSKQLTRLEAELGLQLLNRSTRHVELTEVGANYCEQCRRILDEVDSANALVTQMKVTPHGVLKVLSGRHFASTYIVPNLKQFLTQYPDIHLDLELSERIPDLNVESIDVLIGMSVSSTGDVIQRRIATTRYCFCASPGYLRKFHKPKKPEDLLNHRYITHSMRKPDYELETFGITPYLTVNDAETMLRLAQEGLGIVKLHEYMVRDMLQNGILVEVLSSYAKNDIPLFVAFPQRRYIPSKVRCFIDFVQPLLRKLD